MASKPTRTAGKREPRSGTSRNPLASIGEHVPPRVRRMAAVGTVFGVSVIVIGALAVLPTRTWMDQQNELEAVQTELDEVNADLEQLDAMLDLLETDAEIERRARENFDLVYPGEESYRILEKVED
ncbi:MAG: septum formation initiator family protein [Acidimicrobiales bacterium]